MKTLKITLQILMMLFLVGCSNKSIYQGIQASNQVECSLLPPSQYDECMERINQSYDDYERERAEASEKDAD